jgi:predicted glycoside hydrolase/deacetylase ChbG (UPF0249 family)
MLPPIVRMENKLGNADADTGLKGPQFAYLIVNADDFGHSEGVSRGILEAARQGVVTAVGILANSPFFMEHVAALLPIDGVDAGVHLNLTSGRPLTERLAALLERTGGEFPGNTFRTAFSILAGRIGLGLIEEEWDAQIRRCRDANVRIRFLNSHEHLHMLPPLYRLVQRLADRHGIPFIRHTTAEWFDFHRLATLQREAVLHVFDRLDRRISRRGGPSLIGVSRSGKIDLPYLAKRLASLRRGRVYELMCHPGRPVPGEITAPRLLAYHDWEGELNALLAAKANGLFDSGIVRLARFRDLEAARKPVERGGTAW